MRLQTVPAGHGALWVRRGFRIFFRRPIAFAVLTIAFMIAMLVLALLPFVGALLVLALLPLASLGFMIATRVALDGGLPTPRVFVEPIRSNRNRLKAMVQLGVTYAAATYAIIWLSDLVDGGALEALMDALPAAQTAPDAVATSLNAPGLLFGILLRFGLAGLLAVPFWHAPALVYWDGHGCAKALFSSTLACWRNRGAFTIYSLSWFALIVTFGAMGSLVFALVGMPQLFEVMAFPLWIFFATVFYVSLYFTFADCFIAGESELAVTS
jgi:hypothetical protein